MAEKMEQIFETTEGMISNHCLLITDGYGKRGGNDDYGGRGVKETKMVMMK